MAHAYALINPAMLRWARGRAGLDVNEAALAVGVKPEQFQRWEEGASQPTFRQAQQVANALHAPFGYLFLSEAPADEPRCLICAPWVGPPPAGPASTS